MLYGNTTDCYRTAAQSLLSFDRMLESHLKFLGYQVVLFYRGGDVLECFDKDLKENLNKFFPTDRNAGAKAAESDGKEGTSTGGSGEKPETETAPPTEHKKKPPIIGGNLGSRIGEIKGEKGDKGIKNASSKPKNEPGIKQ